MDVRCDDCGEVFVVDQSSIRSSISMLLGEQVDVSFFYCPKCKSWKVVNVASLSIQDLHSDFEDSKKRYTRFMKAGKKEMALRAHSIMMNKKKKLANRVDRLVNECYDKLELREVNGHVFLASKQK